VRRLGGELGYAVADGDRLDPRPDDLGLVVAAHGRDELRPLRRGLESGVPYVGLVASPRRGTGVVAELRADGVADELLARIDVPAGLDIGARTPPEVALSILARIVAVRHEAGPAAAAPAPAAAATPQLAVDPVCGMTVAAVEGTPSVTRGGETVYFCCEGCKAKYESQGEHAAVAD